MFYAPPGYYKGMFPFKLATTSYIYPDHILPNVERLAPFFDEIELVLFESGGGDNLPDEEQIERLRDLALHERLGFNIHLPIDIFLGDENKEVRSRGISMVSKFIKRTRPLNPSLYTLHFDLKNRREEEGSDISRWQKYLIQSAEGIIEEGIEPERISIETLHYPYEWVEDIVKQFGFSICLDIGHLLLYGKNLPFYLERYLSKSSIVHLHGFQDGVDHLGIDKLNGKTVDLILSYLRDYRGILSIEVFSLEDLKNSLELMEERWERR